MTPRLYDSKRALRFHAALSIALPLLLLACSGNPTAPGPYSADARFEGQLGDARFVARAEAYIVKMPGAPDTLHLLAIRDNASPGTSETLAIRVAFTGVGEYLLGEDQITFYELVGGDGVIGSRAGSHPTPGVLTISEYDGRTAVLRGTARFWLSPSQGITPDPEPVEFTEGSFAVKLGAPIMR